MPPNNEWQYADSLLNKASKMDIAQKDVEAQTFILRLKIKPLLK